MTYVKHPYGANKREKLIIDILNDIKRVEQKMRKVQTPQARFGLMKLKEILISWHNILND